MAIEIRENPQLLPKKYLTVSMKYKVTTFWDPVPPPAGQMGLTFVERQMATPYTKDYDDGIDPEAGLDWSQRWDVSNWGIFGAYDGELLVGCAAVVYDTKGVNLLDGRSDITVLWDFRVAPSYRGRGVGTKLFETAVAFSKARRAVGMKVETQNINVNACRFYAKMGCYLIAINTMAYADLPHEIQLMWFYSL